MKKKIMVTGIGGFIGFHLSKRLISEGYEIIGIDNLNHYYDPSLKNERIKQLRGICDMKSNSFELYITNLENVDYMREIFKKHCPNIVINLAAQAGVRYSLENPYSYITSNLEGFGIILENCKKYKIKNFIFASSSSIYGGNKNLPFDEDDPSGIFHALTL